MNRGNKKFYTGFLALFFVFTSLILAAQFFQPKLIHLPTVWFSQIFLLVVILISHYLSSKGLKNKAVDFHIFYMASMGIRFLLSVFYLFFIVYFYPSVVWVAVLNFFLLYFTYTSFEIYSLMSNLRAEN